jgi:hypothetical protein
MQAQAHAVEEAAYALDNRLGREGLSKEAQAEYDRLLEERYYAASAGQAAPSPSSGAPMAQHTTKTSTSGQGCGCGFGGLVFVAVQIGFIVWIVKATHNAGTQNTLSAIHQCAGLNWYPLYTSYADCIQQLSNAANTGTHIGVGLVVAFWVVADLVLLGIGGAIARKSS